MVLYTVGAGVVLALGLFAGLLISLCVECWNRKEIPSIIVASWRESWAKRMQKPTVSWWRAFVGILLVTAVCLWGGDIYNAEMGFLLNTIGTTDQEVSRTPLNPFVVFGYDIQLVWVYSFDYFIVTLVDLILGLFIVIPCWRIFWNAILAVVRLVRIVVLVLFWAVSLFISLGLWPMEAVGDDINHWLMMRREKRVKEIREIVTQAIRDFNTAGHIGGGVSEERVREIAREIAREVMGQMLEEELSLGSNVEDALTRFVEGAILQMVKGKSLNPLDPSATTSLLRFRLPPKPTTSTTPPGSAP